MSAEQQNELLALLTRIAAALVQQNDLMERQNGLMVNLSCAVQDGEAAL